MMSDHRIGVHDERGDGVTRWYQLESAEACHTAWQLLRDYGREGIEVTVQLRGTLGQWLTVDPLFLTRPHDWPPEDRGGDRP
jgi:hypothetical protein